MNKQRPVFLDLTKISFPVMAIVSIFHRISGFIVFLFIPFLLSVLSSSLTADGYAALTQDLQRPVIKIILWVFLVALIYHMVAGIRHLLMDIHIGEELRSGRIGAWITIIVSLILIIFAGIWLW